MPKQCDKRRVRELNEKEIGRGSVFYLMSREQRVSDNWALVFAKELAESNNTNLSVVFFLDPKLLEASLRQYDFMIKGLIEIEERLEELNIPFFLMLGNPLEEIPIFLKKHNPGVVVTDFNPLKIKKQWKKKLVQFANCKVFEVDAHNIVPCFFVSQKQEFAAYTIRPKIKKVLPEFLTSFPKIQKQNRQNIKNKNINWEKVYSSLRVDKNITPVTWITSGERASNRELGRFIKTRLDSYHENRNNPLLNGQSNLSPYLHFGHLSSQRVAIKVQNTNVKSYAKEDFLEELIVRKELSDNFCYYNNNYDNFNGFPNWSKETLNKHRQDKRLYIYNHKDFESAKTHDELWNAAQREMMIRGKMHGYMRMYWAKKILEWTTSPEEALKVAIKLNDKYELDGRDSNGYTGIAWSIGGVHDRAWGERSVFGKVRYMSYNGSKSKFGVKKYIDKNQ